MNRSDLQVQWECPHCGYLSTIYLDEVKVIVNGLHFICNHCKKTIVVELYTVQDEEDMEAE